MRDLILQFFVDKNLFVDITISMNKVYIFDKEPEICKEWNVLGFELTEYLKKYDLMYEVLGSGCFFVKLKRID